MVTATVIQANHRGASSLPLERDSDCCPYLLDDVEHLLAVSRHNEWHDKKSVPTVHELSRMLYGVHEALSGPLLDRFLNLRRYLHFVQPDASEELGKLLNFRFLRPVKVTMTPGALVVYVDGWDYGAYAHEAGLRTKNDPVSFGVTLTAPSLPSELRGAIVIVNVGDGWYNVRSPADIMKTRDHELSHVQYSLGFQKHPFIHYDDLRSLCQSVSYPFDLKEHAEVAGKLRRGIDAWAHTELIAYGVNGIYTPLRCSLGGNLWPEHHNVVRNYLNSWYPGNAAASEVIVKMYYDAEIAHRADLDRYNAYSRNIFQSRQPIRAEAVLLCTPFGI